MSRAHLSTLALLVALASAGLACPGRSAPQTVPPGGGTGTGTADTGPAITAEPPLPLWDRVTKGVLPNGLTYYVVPHHKPANRAYLWLAVNAGSVQEDDDQQGLAHFVEHMAFNGTAKYEGMAIVNYLESSGMQFGADVNAHTSFDETVYKLQVPTDDPAIVAMGLDVLHQWASAISFDPKEVEKERGVVLEEWRLGQGAGNRVFDQQVGVLFGDTRYATRLPIGKPEIIKTAPRDALVRYYKDWYRPELMAVIVVGDVDPVAMAKDLEARFGDLRGPDAPRVRPRGGVPTPTGLRVSIVTDPEMTAAQVGIENMFAHRSESTASDYRRLLADGLYHTMLNERLAELARRPDAPFQWGFSTTGSSTLDIESFSRAAGAREGRVEDTLVALLTEVVRVERHGFTASELVRAKRAMLRGIEQAAREIDKRDGYELVAELVRNFFEGELVIGRAAEAELTAKLLPGVTLEELNSLANAWGGDDSRAVLLSGPDGMKAPTEARVRELVAAAAATKVEPWVDDAAGDTLMTKAPTAGTIVTEQALADDVTVWTLSNGAKVVIKPTDYEADTVLVRAFSPGGTATASDKVWPSARFATSALTGSGVGEHTPGALAKVLTGRVVSVWPWIGETQEGFWGSSSALDLEPFMQLAYLRMTAPRRDEALFASWKLSTLEWVKNRRKQPERAFFEDMGTVAVGNHARRRPPEVADVEKVDLDQAIAFYQDRFGDASDFTFVVVGNVELATLRPLVETYLASLPGKGRVEKEKDLGFKRPKGITKKKVIQGQEPKSSVFLTFHGDAKWSRDASRDLATLIDVLDFRLREILREDMGGVYGVGVWGGAQRRPRQEWSVSVQFGCAPEAVEPLRKAIFAEIARLQKEGIADSYLEKVKQQRLRGREVALRDNNAWAGWLADAFQYGDDVATVMDLDGGLARLSSANVKAAAKTYLGKQYVFGVLEPKTTAKAAK